MGQGLRQRAVLIGVDRYWTEFAHLRGAVADAIALAEWLTGPGGVAVADCHLMLAPTARSPAVPATLDGCPRHDATGDALDRLLCGWVERPDPVERFWFAFSGHGASTTGDAYQEEALCLGDYVGGAFRRAVEMTSLLGVLNAIPADERYILIDGCRDEVNRDGARFGTLSLQRRPASVMPRNMVLRATAPGRAAAEVKGRGLFSRALVEGLAGVGNAKRWEKGSGDSGYVVRWSTLIEAVAAVVDTDPTATGRGQLIYEDSKRPGSFDPVLARFPAGHFPSVEVTVRLATPRPVPPAAQVLLRRNGSSEPDRAEPVPADGVVRFSVPPSSFVAWAGAPGHRSIPEDVVVSAYGSAAEADFSLAVMPPGVHLKAFTEARVPLSPGDGQLEVRFAGEGKVPLPRLTVAAESGAPMALPADWDGSPVALPAGVYRVTVTVASGQAATVTARVVAGWARTVTAQLPDTATLALAVTLARANKPAPINGMAEPSESVGPIVAPSLATLGAFAVGQSVLGYRGELLALGLGADWAQGNATGVQLLLADEVEPVSRLLSARLWRMRSINDGVRRQVEPGAPGLGGAALFAEPGGWWLELSDTDLERPPGLGGMDQLAASGGWRPDRERPPWLGGAAQFAGTGGWWLESGDTDRERRAAFRMATAVLPGHVTLVVRHRLQNGRLRLWQAMIQRPADGTWVMGERLAALAQAEAVQAVLSRGAIDDPNVSALAEGRWFEPVSAVLAAAAALDAGEIDLARKLAARLDGLPLVDAVVLGAALASAAGDDPQPLLQRALAMNAAPLAESLMVRLAAMAREEQLFGAPLRWIEEKLAQSVSHPLLTLRREDDKSRTRLREATSPASNPH